MRRLCNGGPLGLGTRCLVAPYECFLFVIPLWLFLFLIVRRRLLLLFLLFLLFLLLLLLLLQYWLWLRGLELQMVTAARCAHDVRDA